MVTGPSVKPAMGALRPSLWSSFSTMATPSIRTAIITRSSCGQKHRNTINVEPCRRSFSNGANCQSQSHPRISTPRTIGARPRQPVQTPTQLNPSRLDAFSWSSPRLSTGKSPCLGSYVQQSRYSMSHRPTNYLTDRVCIEAMRQSRCVSSISGPKRDYLAKLEASANAKPDSVNLQNSFYSALLLLRMPSIVIERQATGRYASNDVTIMLKGQAELDMNPGSRGRARSGLDASQAMATHTASLTDANTAETTKTSAAPAANIPTAQATNAHIARAVATLNGPGASPGLVRTKGNRGEPIHVVVDESLKTVIFRWVKFLAIFVVATYLCFALVTILVEALGTLRRGAGNAKDAEVKAEKQTTRFSDVHGCEEAKEELAEVVDFLKNPEQFSDLGAKLPKGVLLVGQPGTGKTLLARAVAGEAGVPFFYMSGSEFDEIFVGVGAKRVRDLFKTAKAKSPAIVFIDELDAIGGKRNPRDQAHAKQTLNQLLTELDGFDQDTRIIIMAATNLPKLLDKALTRPGRFDRHINVELPDYRGRFAILKHHASKIKAAPDVDFESVAARTPGRSGAELENMINVAALKASRAKASMVSKTDMEWAFDRLTMGSERRSIVITEKDKEMTAYHEAGHALVQLYDKESSATLYKITVLPKGPSLGHTAMLPVRDKYSQTAAEYLSQIRVLLGGKMAEELQYGTERSTSGVSSDLERATDLGFNMVTNLGMSAALGPMEYHRRYEHLSSRTRALIETEVQNTLKKEYEGVRELLTDKRKELDLLAQALVKYETLDKAEVESVLRGEELIGKPVMPKGAVVVPIPENATHVPGLEGIPVPQPSGSEAESPTTPPPIPETTPSSHSS